MSIFDSSPCNPDRVGKETGEFVDLPRSRSLEAQALLDRIDELLDVCDLALASCVEYPDASAQSECPSFGDLVAGQHNQVPPVE